MQIGFHTYEQYLTFVESFHGFKAPGVLIGGVMVSLALKHIPEKTLFNAIPGTSKSLAENLRYGGNLADRGLGSWKQCRPSAA